MHTLMDCDGGDSPEWKTALTARLLAWYKVQTAALSETQLAKGGQLIEIGMGYIFFLFKCSKY